jgi:hypothetical protein
LIAFFNLVNKKIQLGYSENLFDSAMEFIQSRVEPWMREQGARLMKVSWGPLQWRMKWPWTNHREQKKRIKEEYQRRRKQLNDLCLALKTDSLSDLQDLLCCMVLSECVYKVFFYLLFQFHFIFYVQFML